VSRLDPVGLFTTRELAEWHEGDCLWVDMLQDMDPSALDPIPLTTSLIEPNPESQSHGSSHSLQNEPTNLPQNESTSLNPTYASVLKTPPQPELKLPPCTSQLPSPSSSKTSTAQSCRNSVTSTSSSKISTAQSCHKSGISTLTIDNLYKRFHNRPPPLNSTRFGMPQHYLNIAATNSLSKFLLSALPAFTTFLSDIQGHYNTNIYCGAITYNSRPTSVPRAWTKGHKRPC